MSRTRVLYVINGFQRGGAEQGLVRLVRDQAFAGCELRIVSIVSGSRDILHELSGLGADVRVMSERPDMRMVDLATAAPKLAAQAWSFRPHISILSLPQANILGRLTSLAAPMGLVASFEHNTHLSHRIYERAYRLTSGRVDWLLADARATAEEAQRRLYRRAPREVMVLPLVSFAHAAEPAVRAEGPLRLVNAARFTTVKNQAALIRAAALLRDRGIAVELTLLGEGPERAACVALAAQLGVEDRVRIPGYAADWMRSGTYDLFVLGSRHEGLCIAVLEAMSRGMGVVAPRIGGLNDYGSPETVEFVADVEPATLADAVARLHADRARLAQMARAGAAMVQARFGASAVRRDYAAFAERLRGLSVAEQPPSTPCSVAARPPA
jgi:glycosyltransferase involved in cell wall biosynthesis